MNPEMCQLIWLTRFLQSMKHWEKKGKLLEYGNDFVHEGFELE